MGQGEEWDRVGRNEEWDGRSEVSWEGEERTDVSSMQLPARSVLVGATWTYCFLMFLLPGER